MNRSTTLKTFKDSKEPNNILYICKALSDTKLDEPYWQIKRFSTHDDSDSLMGAEGSSDYKFKASERENLEYK